MSPLLLPIIAVLFNVVISLDLEDLSVPEGFTISRYIDEDAIEEPRSLAMAYYEGATIIYVGSMNAQIYALIDYESDGINDKVYNIWTASSSAVKNVAIDPINNDLYIARFQDTYKCSNIHSQVLSLTDDDYTVDCEFWFEGVAYTRHGDHYMVYDTINNQLCMAFGANCNICERNYPETTILCFNDMEYPDLKNVKIQARGVRHSVGLEFHPYTNELWFTDNNRDRMGNDYPDGKLNHVSVIGEDFGYPYCHSGGFGDPYLRDVGVACHIVDDEFGDLVNGNCSNFTLSAQALGPHVAALGMKFYHNKWNESAYMFPDRYYNAIFVAQHGSWNRDTKIGARVMVAFLGCDERVDDYSRVVGYETFLDGMIVGDSYIGRPVDVEMLIDGSILISDDESNNIYRIVYDMSLEDDTMRYEYLCNDTTKELKELVMNGDYSEYCVPDFVSTAAPTGAPDYQSTCYVIKHFVFGIVIIIMLMF